MQYNPPPPPVSLRLLCLLCAVYLLTGLLDHDLWKYEDAVHLGVAWDMASNGHWLQPQLAGQPWGEGPLYYWLAATLGKLLGGVFDFHNAARLATAVFGAATLYALGRIAALTSGAQRNGHSHDFNVAAPLLLICAPGLLLPIHDAQPMIAVLAGHAFAYWGMALLAQPRPRALLPATGLLLAGLLIAALAGGFGALLAPAGLLLLPLLAAPWRSRQALTGLAIAAVLAAALLLGAASLLPLSLPGPYLFAPDRKHLELLAWFAWPALPIALWSLWLHRRQPGLIALPLAGSLGALIWFLLCSEPRNLPALPLLVPLTLLAASGAARLRRGAANALDWFGMMTFSLLGLFLWLGQAALQTGTPPKLHRNITRLIPGYDNDVGVLAWIFAALVSVIWLLVIVLGRRTPWRSTRNWACGMVLIWCLSAALWIPAVDYGKRYSAMNHQIAAKVGKLGAGQCVAGVDLESAQRAALHYHTGIIIRSDKAGARCDWLLVQGQPRREPKVDAGWTKVWDGARPSDREDRYYLYKR